MWRRSDESKPALSSSQPAAFDAPVRLEPPAPGGATDLRPSKTVLGRGLVLKGDLAGREDICIEGQFDGNIRLAGAGVTIGASGRVTAEVEADEIVVEGRLEGSLRARERVVIRRTGSVAGDITAQRLAIEDGAIFRGRVEMARPGETRATQATAADRAVRETFHRVPVEVSEPAR